MPLRTEVRHHRLRCLGLEFTRIKADVALLGSAKPHVIYKDIKYIFYDYNDAKNFVDDSIVTSERLHITTGEESREGNGNEFLWMGVCICCIYYSALHERKFMSLHV